MPRMFSDESLKHFPCKFCDTAGLKNPQGAFDSRHGLARDDNEQTERPEMDKVQQLISKLGLLVEGNTRNEVFKQAVDLLNQIRDAYGGVLATHETTLNAQTAAQDDESLGAGNGPYPPDVEGGKLSKDSRFTFLRPRSNEAGDAAARLEKTMGKRRIGHSW